MNVSVVGLGYVGLPIAHALCAAGIRVRGVDIDFEVVERLQKENEDNSNLEISTEYSLIGDSEIIVICVPTPLCEDDSMDLSILREAVRETSEVCKSQATVIIESTSFVGSLRNFVWPILKQSGKDLRCGVAPERIDPGNSRWNIRNTPRLVAGMDEQTTQIIFNLYSQICDSVITVSSPEVAEAAKLFENTFRLVNIALSMEIGSLLQDEGINFIEVLNAANTKSFGFMPFFPSLGIGGHCIPVDPVYLNSSFASNPQGSSLINVAIDINNHRVQNMKFQLQKLGLIEHGMAIQILGIGYKNNSSDTRESAPLELLQSLREDGYDVEWHDPMIREISGEKSFDLNTNADTWIIGSWNDEFQNIAFSDFSGRIVTFSVVPNEVGATLIL